METGERGERIRQGIEAMIRTMRLHHRIVEKRIDGLGVHHSQHRMLMRLSQLGKSASQKDLAEAMDVSPACVARTLKHLSAEGLVEKTEGADGRCNAISITPAGARLVEDSLALFRRIDAEMFRGLSADELNRLNALLARLQDNLSDMEKRDAEGSPSERKGADTDL